MARSLFFTNHLQVLSELAARPDLRLRDIAERVGITERAAQRIIAELIEEGYLVRTRVGARNHYAVNGEASMPSTGDRHRTIAHAIRLMVGDDPRREPGGPSAGDQPSRSDSPSSDLLSAAFAAAPAGIAVADAQGQLQAVNGAFCELMQRQEHELVGRSIFEFTHPDGGPTNQERAELIAGERSSSTRETRYLRDDGSYLWVQVRLAVASDPGSGRPLVVAHVTDISERRRRDHALAEAEERFRHAFDNAPIGMALVAPDGRWLKVNRATCELTGYAETALLVRSFQDITHHDDLNDDLALVEDVLAGRRRSYQMEKRYYHADGHLIWVLLSVSLVRGDRGEPLYFVSQLEDITERKRREQVLARAADG